VQCDGHSSLGRCRREHSSPPQYQNANAIIQLPSDSVYALVFLNWILFELLQQTSSSYSVFFCFFYGDSTLPQDPTEASDRSQLGGYKQGRVFSQPIRQYNRLEPDTWPHAFFTFTYSYSSLSWLADWLTGWLADWLSSYPSLSSVWLIASKHFEKLLGNKVRKLRQWPLWFSLFIIPFLRFVEARHLKSSLNSLPHFLMIFWSFPRHCWCFLWHCFSTWHKLGHTLNLSKWSWANVAFRHGSVELEARVLHWEIVSSAYSAQQQSLWIRRFVSHRNNQTNQTKKQEKIRPRKKNQQYNTIRTNR